MIIIISHKILLLKEAIENRCLVLYADSREVIWMEGQTGEPVVKEPALRRFGNWLLRRNRGVVQQPAPVVEKPQVPLQHMQGGEGFVAATKPAREAAIAAGRIDNEAVPLNVKDTQTFRKG